MKDYHCETFENGVRIGGFVITAENMGMALMKAGKNIEVAIRPEMQELRVSILKRTS